VPQSNKPKLKPNLNRTWQAESSHIPVSSLAQARLRTFSQQARALRLKFNFADARNWIEERTYQSYYVFNGTADRRSKDLQRDRDIAERERLLNGNSPRTGDYQEYLECAVGNTETALPVPSSPAWGTLLSRAGYSRCGSHCHKPLKGRRATSAEANRPNPTTQPTASVK